MLIPLQTKHLQTSPQTKVLELHNIYTPEEFIGAASPYQFRKLAVHI